MPVETDITNLSTTAASNNPPGGEAVFPSLDNYVRQIQAFIATLRNSVISGTAGITTTTLAASGAATAASVTASGLLKGNGGGDGLGKITVSTSTPSGGANGDIWLQY